MSNEKTKLLVEVVRILKESGWTQSKIATALGLSPARVSELARNFNWYSETQERKPIL